MLVTRTFQGRVRPVFMIPSNEALELAREMIGIYSEGIGKRQREIADEIASLEGGAFDFRAVRGLKAVLDKSSTYSPDSPVDPRELRRRAFAASKGPALDDYERSRALTAASEGLGITVEDADRIFWGDLEAERTLSHFEPMEPIQLLARYNLSLMQTLLFRSTSLEIQAPGNWKPVLRRAKQLGLMYEIDGAGEGQRLIVEGPASAIKLTERYGTSLAKLIPQIIRCSQWSVKAGILTRWREPRLLSFSLSSEDGVLLPTDEAIRNSETFDSALEEDFYRRFSSLGSRWKILREPDMIRVGSGKAFLPDFAFELHKRRIYLEIVGFWTPEYISRKIEKLKGAGNVEMIIAVDRSLGITADFPGGVVFFENEVPLKPIIDCLERAEEELITHETGRLSGLSIPVEGDVVSIGGLAGALGVPQEALRKHFESTPPAGYVLAGWQLVKESKMAEIDSELAGVRALKRACEILESQGITDPYPILERLSYSVRMSGLAIDGAEIKKKEKNREERSG